MRVSNKRPSGRKEERVMAEGKITPQAPEKADTSSSTKTAAARVSKRKMSKRKLSTRKMSK